MVQKILKETYNYEKKLSMKNEIIASLWEKLNNDHRICRHGTKLDFDEYASTCVIECMYCGDWNYSGGCDDVDGQTLYSCQNTECKKYTCYSCFLSKGKNVCQLKTTKRTFLRNKMEYSF